jgi:predicted MFS family arabinose efflux permease
VSGAHRIDDGCARRNAVILALAQACFGAATTALVVTAGLIGTQLAPDPSWATLPLSMTIVGTALTTFPQSLLMKRIGRRAGFVAAALVGSLGAIIGVFAIFARNFTLFLTGCFLIGIYQASSSYYRFAAADHASPEFRPKAISWVMTGGVAAAIFGSVIVMLTTDLLAPVTFAGTWVAMAVIAAAAAVILTAVNIPLPEGEETAAGRPLAEIAAQPRYIVATATAMVAFGVMMLVMTATPVAMLGCGFSVTDSSWVIQWHALAMFAPSFFTGNLIAKYGAERIAAVGMVLLALAGTAGLMGIRFEHFAVDLILLGLGWNFGYIGGTAMLTATYAPGERNKAQGLNDLLVFGVTALASLSAGKLLSAFGWNAVNVAVFPLVMLAFTLVVWLWTRPRPA